MCAILWALCVCLELSSGSRMVHTATATSPLLTVPITLDLLKDTVNHVSTYTDKSVWEKFKFSNIFQFPSEAEKLKNIQSGNL